MRCGIESQEHTEKLLAWCSHRLDGGDAAAIERHVQSCAACREFVQRQQAVLQALDNWEAPPVSPDFDHRLYARIAQDVSWWDRLVRPFRPLALRQGLPIAAAAALMIVAGLLVERPANRPPAPVPESAQVETASPDQVERALDDMEMLRELNHVVRSENTEKRM